MFINLGQFEGKKVKATFKRGAEFTGKVTMNRHNDGFPFNLITDRSSLSLYGFRATGEYRFDDQIILIEEIVKPSFDWDLLNELQDQDAWLKERETELQKQLEEVLEKRLKVRKRVTEMKTTGLPRAFNREAVNAFLEDPSNTDPLMWAFDWDYTPQGRDYWDHLYRGIVEDVDAEVIDQLRKWVVQSYQNDL